VDQEDILNTLANNSKPIGGAKTQRGLGLGVLTAPLFENVGLVIRPNLHRNSEGGVMYGEELFLRFDCSECLKF